MFGLVGHEFVTQSNFSSEPRPSSQQKQYYYKRLLDVEMIYINHTVIEADIYFCQVYNYVLFNRYSNLNFLPIYIYMKTEIRGSKYTFFLVTVPNENVSVCLYCDIFFMTDWFVFFFIFRQRKKKRFNPTLLKSNTPCYEFFPHLTSFNTGWHKSSWTSLNFNFSRVPFTFCSGILCSY